MGGEGGQHGPGGQHGREERDSLIPKNGGYRKLKSFQVSQLIYDVTVRFCERYISKFSRTRDQMVQAARSGVQNIAEGSKASGTSKKTELKLTNVARASLEELRLDYEDFLRQQGLPVWERSEPLRADLIARRCASADEVDQWVHQLQKESQCHPEPLDSGMSTSSTESMSSTMSTLSTKSTSPEIMANAALVLIAVACSLLNRQIEAQAKAFEEEGGFTERMYSRRLQRRSNRRDIPGSN